ncbi:PA2169 family four-helix-bundle protein [Sphingorhabdus contaminans]|uniref:PA2169 family four-helix-bundle protein n=1 Tax=Sphingorhabdus contaminans TaxID=1343899 RepID=A0A553WAI4_9SPHN|nr:PA2169 family four-helix-bundle protein [Sphingorhabdus contaminans]TSB01700.1 PA2169 family four-helix-bundle protein [Sphingorhabdus contaminans]
MTPNEREVDTLNDLIKTTIDSVDGYRSAAEDAEQSQYRSIFFDRANERKTVTEELQSRVRTLGGEPTTDGSVLAGAHRAFLDLKSAITGNDDNAIIAEVERGEDHIKHKFEEALIDRDFSPETRAVIERCYQSVKQGHDQMSNLKHATQAR